jgi:hypothetical protein
MAHVALGHARYFMSFVIDQREALNLLARSTHGYRESILLAHGFPIEMLRRLMRDGLIRAEREPTYLNRGAIVVTRVRITDAGRRAVVG